VIAKSLPERLLLLHDRAAGKIKTGLETSNRAGQADLDNVIASVLTDVAAQSDTRTSTDSDSDRIERWLARHAAAAGGCGSPGPFTMHNMTVVKYRAESLGLPGPYVYSYGPLGASVLKGLKVEAFFDDSGRCSLTSLKYESGTALLDNDGTAFLFNGTAWRVFSKGGWTTVSLAPPDKEPLWKEAQNRLAGGMRDDARRFLRAFIQRFPNDPRASQAQLQIGQALAQEFKHGLAVAEYMAVLSRFSRSPEVPEAMWFMGESYVALKYCTDAKTIFLDLSKRYPKSPRASQVRERLHDIQKIERNKDLCTG
jgi:Uncharacterized protein conserved in bacteria